MMKWETKDGFYEENKDYVHAFIVVVVVCLVGIWLVYDHYRNEPIYNDTDNTMDRIEERINSIEQRVDTMSKRLAETQKTVESISGRVNTSTGLAKEIESGIGATSERLDSAVQRAGRIQNLVDEIERSNRQRKVHPQETDMAK